MKKNPTIPTAQPHGNTIAGEDVLESGTIPTFENLKELWHQYHQQSKKEKNGETPEMKDRLAPEKQRQTAQEIADLAMELFVNQQKETVQNQKKQKYAWMALSACGYLLTLGITTYLKYKCDDSCSEGSI